MQRVSWVTVVLGASGSEMPACPWAVRWSFASQPQGENGSGIRGHRPVRSRSFLVCLSSGTWWDDKTASSESVNGGQRQQAGLCD